MHLGRCCHCGETPSCTGWFRRLGAMSFPTPDQGDESLSWEQISTDSMRWTPPSSSLSAGTYLLEPVRWSTHAATTENQQFVALPQNGYEINPVYTPSDTGNSFGGNTGVYGGNYGTPPLETVRFAPMWDKVLAGTHFTQSTVSTIVAPIKWTLGSNRLRVRYIRVYRDGVDATGIIDVITDNTDWTNSKTGTSAQSDIDTTPYPQGFTLEESFTFRRGYKYDIDVWFEFKAAGTTDPQFQFLIGSSQTDASNNHVGITKANGGIFGLNTGVNNGFSASTHTYQLTFAGGTWRPSYHTSDVVTFDPGETYHTVEACYAQIYPVDGFGNRNDDFIFFGWRSEMPFIRILPYGSLVDGQNYLWYAPEDNGGFIQNWNLPRRTVSGTNYVYAQAAGGVFNGAGPTAFKRFFPVQVNTTGTFTDYVHVDAPQTITVERVNQ